MKKTLIWAIAAILALVSPEVGLCQEKVKVVGSIPDFAYIAKEVGGDLVEVSWIARGNQDPHFVTPKPSYALALSDADLFINTGIDLEMWAPPLLDKARNPKILEGAVGYVSASHDMQLIQVPLRGTDRSSGEVHVYGNPHFQTCPLRMKVTARNISIGLQKVDPGNAERYEAGCSRFCARIDSAMYGTELVELLGSDLLDEMVMSGTLIEFLESEEIDGMELIDMLGGWQKAALPFRGVKIIGYHKNWDYFALDFGLQVIDYIEPKPGIPPTARHVKEVIDKIADHDIRLMLIANYFERHTPRKIEERTGITSIFLPLSVTAEPGIDTLFQLYDHWIEELNEAVRTR